MDNQQLIVTTKHENGIIQIHLNRPTQLNALNHEVLQQLSQLLHETEIDKSIKAILLTGEGKAFCAGADIKELSALSGSNGLQFARFGQHVFRQLELLSKPSLAAIQGFAFGGGCELAMSATLRIAVERTQFGQPEIKLGVIPGFGGTQRLARLVGKGRALELCLTGRRFTAEEALHWGLITEITTAEELIPRAKKILTDIASLSRMAVTSVMAVIQQGYNLPLDEALELEAAYFGLCCTTADKIEGVNAFLEKRTAIFSGE